MKSAYEQLLEALTVAQETIAGWSVDERGYVKVHKDVISKAVNAAAYIAVNKCR